MAFSREGEDDVEVEGLTFEGTVDGALFYSWNGGEGDENNFVFNRMFILQAEEPVEPVEPRYIGIMGTWNPDTVGDYDFYVGPSSLGDAIGTVALSVTPDNGNVTVSPASVEVPGDSVAAFTVSVNSLPGDGEEIVEYTITATPADESIPPATFGVKPTQPYGYLTSEKWQYSTDDGVIFVGLRSEERRVGKEC